MACPADDALARLVDGEVDPDERARLLAHVESCDACLAVVAGAQPDSAAPRAYRPGDRLGRYQIVDVLGAGAMGVVYQARDLELERTVALKVVRRDRALDDDEALGERLRGEARALARVSSPYVVAVHDVGVEGDDVFIAMECVDGATLRAWLAEAPRPPRAILAAFVEAGEGLVAAHQVGVVHRDFKPDNVLVGRDGRTRVGDFGLARTGRALEPSAAGAVVGDGERTLATRTVAGTPAYMAPEQRTSQRATAASDQYAFCLALVEALGGTRIAAGAPLPSSLPEGVRRLVARGLAIAPDDRWPSMRALVDALRPLAAPPRARGRLIAALVGAAGLGVAVAVAVGAGDARSCAVGDPAIATVWSPARAEAVAAAVARVHPRSEVVLPGVLERLDGWRQRWAAERDGSCRDGAGPARDQCLDLQRHQVDAYLRLVEAADPGAIDRLVEASQQLPDPGSCARARIAADDPAARARDVVLEQRIAEAAAARWAGRTDDARRILAEVTTAAVAAQRRGVELHAMIEQGRQGDDAEARQVVRDAAALALELGDDDALAGALAVATELAAQEGDLPLADWLAAGARGVLRGRGGDAGLEAELELSLCKALERSGGAPARTRPTCEQARQALLDAFGASDLRIATADDRLGNVAYWEGRWDQALAHYDASIALTTRVLGAPSNNSRSNRAHVLIELGRAAEAEAILLELQPRFPEGAFVLDGLAIARRRLGDFAGALRADLDALATCQRSGVRACLIWAHVGAGEDLLGLGRHAEAMAAFERALAVGVAPAPIERARIELGRARVLAWQGERARAAAGAAAALAILDGADEGAGPEHATRDAIVAFQSELAR